MTLLPTFPLRKSTKKEKTNKKGDFLWKHTMFRFRNDEVANIYSQKIIAKVNTLRMKKLIKYIVTIMIVTPMKITIYNSQNDKLHLSSLTI